METVDRESLTKEALDAFGEIVARRYPQAKTGDLSPLTTFLLSHAAENAIEEWVDNNVPTQDHYGTN